MPLDMPPAREAEWRLAGMPVPYDAAVDEMERRVAAIAEGAAPELFWFLQHPPLYTAGTSAKDSDLINAHGLPVHKTGRGGQFTWHGPGQRVIYALRDLRRAGRDVKRHVCDLEEWMIRALADFGVKGERRQGRIGIWVERPGAVAVATAALAGAEQSRPHVVEEKIGAIGVRVRRWIAYHGLALNVDPDLAAFKGIVPCGLPQFGVTSLAALGVQATMDDVDAAFHRHAESVFGLSSVSCG